MFVKLKVLLKFTFCFMEASHNEQHFENPFGISCICVGTVLAYSWTTVIGVNHHCEQHVISVAIW
jgi:hypothetical protein